MFAVIEAVMFTKSTRFAVTITATINGTMEDIPAIPDTTGAMAIPDTTGAMAIPDVTDATEPGQMRVVRHEAWLSALAGRNPTLILGFQEQPGRGND